MAVFKNIKSDNFGDKSFFKQTFHHHYRALRLFANKYLRDMDLAHDVVHEVFIYLWNNKVVVEQETLKQYLYKCVYNKCIRTIQQKKDSQEFSDDLLNSESFYKYSQMEVDIHHRLYEIINQLSPKTKEVILLSLKDYSVESVAKELNISVNTVKDHKKKAYKLIKKDFRFGFLLLQMSFLMRN
ncbi:MAG: sigma-70 family RNA polymerase sigma factor [Marinifilaceae bacterium]|jgi:RNA polymerase sigma-70 factor (ECF subfamily)|nr:sigma-70 family RNA polymerase sigma factor [Marinifilaceae bacterium]